MPRQLVVGDAHGRVDVRLGARRPSRRAWANWRAASQFSGPWPASALARSPNIGSEANGSVAERIVVRALLGSSSPRPCRRCYGGTRRRIADGTRRRRASPARCRSGCTSAGADGGLGRRVLAAPRPPIRRRRGRRPTTAPTSSSTSAAGDHDTRARRRESVTDGCRRDARRRHRRRRHATSCSCPRRWCTAPMPNNPVRSPRTPCCAPTSSSSTPASWPRSRRWSTTGGGPTPGRTRHRAAPGGGDGRRRHVVAGRGARRRARPALRRGRPGGPVPPPRRPRLRRRRSPSTAPRRRVQRGARRLGRRRAGARAHRRRGRASSCPIGSPRWSADLRWRFQRGPIPPGLRSYTRAPWLVANDRLKAHGWTPTVTNEQAYVEGTEARWWTMITPKRRQELSLAGDGRRRAGRRRSCSSVWWSAGGAGGADVGRRRPSRRGRRVPGAVASSIASARPWSSVPSATVVGRRRWSGGSAVVGRGRSGGRRASWHERGATCSAVGAQADEVAVVVEHRRALGDLEVAEVDHRRRSSAPRRGPATVSSGSASLVGHARTPSASRAASGSATTARPDRSSVPRRRPRRRRPRRAAAR